MLLDNFGSDGILVEGEGYDYPRYLRVYPGRMMLILNLEWGL